MIPEEVLIKEFYKTRTFWNIFVNQENCLIDLISKRLNISFEKIETKISDLMNFSDLTFEEFFEKIIEEVSQ